MRIAVFLPNWVGDLTMATPALRALRRTFADSWISGILRPQLGEVLAGTHFLNDLIFFDPHSRQLELSAWHLLRRLKEMQLDTAVLLTNSLRTALLAWAAGARERIGFSRNVRGWLLTRRLHFRRLRGRRAPAPVLDDYLRLAYVLGCPMESPRLELATTDQDERRAEHLFERLRIHSPLVCLNSSGAYGAAKLWPSEYFAQLARRIAIERDLNVLILCGPSERATARAIAQTAGHPKVASLADEDVGLGLTKACIRRSALLVTTDSGPRHFAAAFDVPVITLFGPTHIAWSETHYARAIHLQQQVPCGPCQKRICPLGHHRCMRELRVETVYRAVEHQLDQPWTAQAA